MDYLELLNTHTNKLPSDKVLVEAIVHASMQIDIEFKNIKHRLYHLVHGMSDTPVCPVCNVGLVNWDKANQKYTETCGRKCATKKMANNITTRQKIADTNTAKYGGVSPSSSSNVRSKSIATKIDKYGAASGEEWGNKIKRGVQHKHGVDNVSYIPEVNKKKVEAWNNKSQHDLDHISARREATCIQRLGVSNPSHNADVNKKRAETVKSKYGVGCPPNHPDHIRRIIDNNMTMYGCASHTQRHIPLESLSLLNDANWLSEQHHANKHTLTHIASMLQVDLTTVSNALSNLNIEKRMLSGSQAEREVGTFIESLGISIVRNTRSILSGLELDIYIPSHNIAIEYCGLYWHSSAHERITPQYHKIKTDRCAALGIRLITLFEDEWRDQQQLVKNKIMHILHRSESPTIYARKCGIVEVRTNDKRNFFNTHHIQGDGPSSINYGLKYNGVLVGCMSFLKTTDGLILNRFAASCSINGGFSKLLKHITTAYPHSDIVSFADLRWSVGNVYHHNRFVLDKVIAPDYYWVVNGERQHKFNWRHGSRLKYLPLYDPTLSESINMYNHGYYKIYNCGLQRWKLTAIKSKT